MSYALALEVMNGHRPEIVQLLLSRGADANAQVFDYGNILHTAVYLCPLPSIKHIVEYGADVKARGGAYDSALQAASFYLNANVVRLLLEHGADVNARSGRFGSALQIALCGEATTLEMLSQNPETIAVRREYGAT